MSRYSIPKRLLTDSGTTLSGGTRRWEHEINGETHVCFELGDDCPACAALRQERDEQDAEIEAAKAVLTAEGLMGGPFGLGLTLAQAVQKVASVARRAAEMRVAAEADVIRLQAQAKRASAELRHAYRARAEGPIDARLVARAITILEEATTPKLATPAPGGAPSPAPSPAEEPQP